MFVAQKKDTGLSIAHRVTAHDHMKVGTNTLYRMKQALETFTPDLKGVIHSGIFQKVTTLERDGVMPSKVFGVNCTIAKTANNTGIRMFYYCDCPADLPANMCCRMSLDNTFETSQSFSSLFIMLVVAVGSTRVTLMLSMFGGPLIVGWGTQ